LHIRSGQTVPIAYFGPDRTRNDTTNGFIVPDNPINGADNPINGYLYPLTGYRYPMPGGASPITGYRGIPDNQGHDPRHLKSHLPSEEPSAICHLRSHEPSAI
jgi:hypothetical protein